jgi:hypothetical protein
MQAVIIGGLGGLLEGVFVEGEVFVVRVDESMRS